MVAVAMDSAPCRLCGARSGFAFTQTVLARNVHYFDCPDCGYFQTEQPSWLNEAYESAINDVDTGILLRNQLNVRRVVMTLLCFGKLSGSVIDHAGGYGILVRLLRDIGIDARWRDKYCRNLMARGFEAADAPADLLTAFEVFEHLERPVQELRQMLEQAPTVLLSTELVTSPGPPPTDWWYLGGEHGQHIGFFRTRTLAWMADWLGCNHVSDGRSIHLFSRMPIPTHWNLLQKFNRVAPVVSRFALRSKTQSDFEQLRASRR